MGCFGSLPPPPEEGFLFSMILWICCSSLSSFCFSSFGPVRRVRLPSDILTPYWNAALENSVRHRIRKNKTTTKLVYKWLNLIISSLMLFYEFDNTIIMKKLSCCISLWCHLDLVVPKTNHFRRPFLLCYLQKLHFTLQCVQTSQSFIIRCIALPV